MYKDLYKFNIGERFIELHYSEVHQVVSIKFSVEYDCKVVLTQCIDDGSTVEWFYKMDEYAPILYQVE